MIDPWRFQNRDDYLTDTNNVDDDEQERCFNSVHSRFAMEVIKGTVQIHRRYSKDAFDLFEPNSLDWIYLDAMHTYEAVLGDLNLYQSKINDPGFILCDDFTNNVVAKEMHFGVVEAVREFTETNDWHLIAMTNDMFPNCLLSRDAQNECTLKLMCKLTFDIPNIVQINDPWNYSHDHVSFADKRVRLIPTF